MSITLRLTAKELDELETILIRESYDNFNDDITDSDELMQLNMKVSDAITDLKESKLTDVVGLQTPYGEPADYCCKTCGRHVSSDNRYICLDCHPEASQPA